MISTSDDFDRLVGMNLKQFRQLSGLSQQLVAEPLGVSSQQVQKYEAGKNRISAGRLYLLAQLLDVPLAAFYQKAS